MKYTIEVVNSGELETAMKWAEEENWNPGRYDAGAIGALNTQSLFILSDDKKRVGSLVIVRYAPHFAFIGLFMVSRAHRREGRGTALMRKGLEILADVPSIGLYAVPKELKRYIFCGFALTGANSHWVLKNPAHRAVTNKTVAFFDHMNKKVMAFDSRLWGANREKLLGALVLQPNSFLVVDRDLRDHTLNGYGVIRECLTGFRIGPLYCRRFETALSLTRALLNKVPEGVQVTFDIPYENPFLKPFADYFKLTHDSAGDTFEMYKGVPIPHRKHCYGLASLEIG